MTSVLEGPEASHHFTIVVKHCNFSASHIATCGGPQPPPSLLAIPNETAPGAICTSLQISVMWCSHVAAGPQLQILWDEKYLLMCWLAMGQCVVTIPRQFHNIKNHPKRGDGIHPPIGTHTIDTNQHVTRPLLQHTRVCLEVSTEPQMS